jgi:hypothetical protein
VYYEVYEKWTTGLMELEITQVVHEGVHQILVDLIPEDQILVDLIPEVQILEVHRWYLVIETPKRVSRKQVEHLKKRLLHRRLAKKKYTPEEKAAAQKASKKKYTSKNAEKVAAYNKD